MDTICLQLGKDRDPQHATVVVSGEVDLVNAYLIDPAEILRGLTRGALIHVDLTGVSYMDSTGITRLLLLARAANAQGISINYAVREGGIVHRAMRLIGLPDALTIVPVAGEANPPADNPIL